MSKNKIWTSGGRKTSTARLVMGPGSGEILINQLSLKEYFPALSMQLLLLQPFKEVDLDEKKFNLSLKVIGGGKSGQAEACRHAITRALVKYDPDLKSKLKQSGLLTRDPRKKERKKYGLKKARRAPQFSKR